MSDLIHRPRTADSHLLPEGTDMRFIYLLGMASPLIVIAALLLAR
ncbi:hypothetical protein ABZ599_34020 [Streptomyces misionensis]